MKNTGDSFKALIAFVVLVVPLLLLAGYWAGRAHSPAFVAGAPGDGEARIKKGRPGNDESWPEVQAFMKDYSPRKWAAYEKLPSDAQVRLKGQLIARYDEIKRLANNKELYNIEVARVRIEDDIFAALPERKRSHSRERDDEYFKLVERLVKNRMEERKARLSNLSSLVSEDEALKKDSAKFKEFVRERARAIEKNGVGAVQEAQPVHRNMVGGPTTSESQD